MLSSKVNPMAAGLLSGATLVAVLLLPGPARSSHVPEPVWKPRLEMSSRVPAYLDLFPSGQGFALQLRPDWPDYEDPPEAFFYTTADFGRTWKRKPAPEGPYVADFASPTTGYVFTTDQAGREILRTTDGGTTWTPLPDRPVDWNGADSAGAYFDILSAPSESKLLLGGVVSRYFAECRWEGRLAVYRSDDGGQTFEWTELPYDGVVHQIEMLDEVHGVLLVSEWNRINNVEECSSDAESVALRALVTHDGGATWAPFADEPYEFASPPTEMGVHSVGIASPNRLLLGMANGDILTSHDGGETFDRARGTSNSAHPGVDPHYLSRIEHMEFATPDVGYGTSAHGAVWRTRDGGLSWRRERSPQAAGDYSFSSGLAVATRGRAIVVGHTKLSSRVPRHRRP